MGVRFAVWGALAAIAIAPVSLFAKGDTVKITISGGDLAAPVEIADPAIVSRFHVWSGPGTSSNQPQGLNIDWSLGVAESPKGVPIYEITFTTTRQDPGAYVVRYAIDPSTGRGYVYLPGKSEPGYKDNVWLIYRGVEGNWFHAWSEWEKLANPLIAKGRMTGMPRN